MICALRSAFYRFLRTGLLAKTLVFAVLTGIFSVFFVYVELKGSYMIRRPRFIDNSFIIMCVIVLTYIIPFGIALFCSMFSGSDVTGRTINNKITTGLSRAQIFIADMAVSLTGMLIYVICTLATVILFSKIWAVKSNIQFDKLLIELFIRLLLTSAAYAAAYTLLQYFLSNKLLGLVITLAAIPCMMLIPSLILADLDEPYRYCAVNEETGESYWTVNPKYVGGTRRKVYEALYDASPYSISDDLSDFSAEIIASGSVLILSSALGVLAVNKREYT